MSRQNGKNRTRLPPEKGEGSSDVRHSSLSGFIADRLPPLSNVWWKLNAAGLVLFPYEDLEEFARISWYILKLHTDYYPSPYANIVFKGKLTDEACTDIIDSYSDIPADMRAEVAPKILVGQKMSDIDAPGTENSSAPVDWDDRVLRDQVAGFTDTQTNQIKIAAGALLDETKTVQVEPINYSKSLPEEHARFEAQLSEAISKIPGVREGPTFWQLLKNTWVLISSNRRDSTLKHEYGHTVYNQCKIFYDDSFAAAFYRDVTALSDEEKATYAYFIQDYTPNGLSEAFARAFQAINVRNPTSADVEFAKHFKNTVSWVKEYQEHFTDYQVGFDPASDPVMDPFNRHIDTTHLQDPSETIASTVHDGHHIPLFGTDVRVDFHPSLRMIHAGITFGLMLLKDKQRYPGSNSLYLASKVVHGVEGAHRLRKRAKAEWVAKRPQNPFAGLRDKIRPYTK